MGRKKILRYSGQSCILKTYMPHRMFSVGEKLPTPVGLLPFNLWRTFFRKIRNSFEIQRL
jgi:hypothetical protein